MAVLTVDSFLHIVSQAARPGSGVASDKELTPNADFNCRAANKADRVVEAARLALKEWWSSKARTSRLSQDAESPTGTGGAQTGGEEGEAGADDIQPAAATELTLTVALSKNEIMGKILTVQVVFPAPPATMFDSDPGLTYTSLRQEMQRRVNQRFDAIRSLGGRRDIGQTGTYERFIAEMETAFPAQQDNSSPRMRADSGVSGQ